jgi:crotonobetainyl-CoA:carnitine CoA-transferase CaiB-like acyl-CoA transferase
LSVAAATPPTAARPLSTLRVLDLADLWGAHCARILADLGADVVKIEPPGGDPARRLGPFVDDRPDLERSLFWAALNANKRGITLSLGSQSGRDLFRRLVERADVVVESFAPGALDDLGVGFATLASWNPRLILTSVAPYGQEGPLSRVPASDLEVTAMSGALWLAGEPERPPMRTTLPQSPFWAGMYAAMGTLFAYHARLRTGAGQHVDVSAQAAMVTVHPPAPIFWDLLREEHGRLGPYLLGRSIVGARFRNIWPCANGHVAFAIQGGPIGRHTMRKLVEWMEERHAAPEALRRVDWETFDNTTLSQQEVEQLEAAIAPFLASLTKREFFEGVIARNMLGYPVSDVADVYADPQLVARDFWQEVAVAGRGTLRFPGGFALFDGERPSLRRAAPRLGEHDDEIYRGELGLTMEELFALRGSGVL